MPISGSTPARMQARLKVMRLGASRLGFSTLRTISGTITGGANATVTLTGQASQTVTADASGNYQFSNLAPGTYTVTPSQDAHTFTPVSRSVTVTLNVTGVNFTASTVVMSGTISPVAAGSGATVTASWGAGNTGTVIADASGYFLFDGVGDATYQLSVAKSGYTFTPAVQTVTINRASVTGITFSGAVSVVFTVLINGVARKPRIANATIVQNLNSIPDTAAVRVSGFVPSAGQEIAIYMGTPLTLATCEFGGHILNVTTVYEGGKKENVAYDLQCIDYTWRLNDKRVLISYTNVSATTIAQDLMVKYAPAGFSSAGVVAGLPVIDAITFQDEELTDCLDKIAARIGGYWFLDYGKTLQLFLTQGGTADTVSDATPQGWTIDGYDVDLSQIRTRAIVRGGGASALSALSPGMTTIPVEDASWYAATGGVLEIGAQRVTYTGKSAGGSSSSGTVTVGKPGTVPGFPSASQVTPLVTGNLDGSSAGAQGYLYACTFMSEAGESDLSNSSNGGSPLLITKAPGPAIPTGLTATTGGGLTPNSIYGYFYSFLTATGEVTGVIGNNQVALGGAGNAVSMTLIAASDARVKARRLYRCPANQTANTNAYRAVATINDNTTTSYTDTTPDSAQATGATFPYPSDTGSTGQGRITLPLGPAGTTARKLYRTKLGSNGPYLLLTTLNDNSTTTYTDNTADASLGAEFAGATVAAAIGDTSLRIAAGSLPSSGWVQVGGQVIRYTGISGGYLIGIPATGPGSITAPISPGTTVVAAPMLTGIPASGTGAILTAVASGETVAIRVERDDTAAQSALAAMVGGTGIVEDFQSTSLSIEESTNLALARLAAYKDPIKVVRGSTRNVSVDPGDAITFNVTLPPVAGTFKIQTVTVSDLAISPTVFPLRRVQATSQRFTLEDLLRQIRGTQPLKTHRL